MKKNFSFLSIFVIALIFLLAVFLKKNEVHPPQKKSPRDVEVEVQTNKTDSTDSSVLLIKKHQILPGEVKVGNYLKTASPAANVSQGLNTNYIKFIIDEGLIVIQGDLVLGAPEGQIQDANSMVVEAPQVKPWTSRRIAYHIQPSVKNPERVEKALALFAGTAVQFVPYTDQKDVLIFEDSSGVCKSYVGKIGGSQPIWIPPRCEEAEIAHEIMHALGFVHEQNRSDRDQYVEIQEENIDPNFKINFDILPGHMMRLSGLSPFDFQSLMIYPPSAFSSNGQSTMRAKDQRNEINPGEALSRLDVERINAAFGDLPW